MYEESKLESGNLFSTAVMHSAPLPAFVSVEKESSGLGLTNRNN